MLQDNAPDLKTELSGEFLWTLPSAEGRLLRMWLGCCHCQLWTPQKLLPRSPSTRLSACWWARLESADKALFKAVQADCEQGAGALPREQKTEFEKSRVARMLDQDVLAHLQFLPAGGTRSGASSSGRDLAGITGTRGHSVNVPDKSYNVEMQRLRSRLENAERTIMAVKRKYQPDDGHTRRRGRGCKGGAGRRGKLESRKPREFGDLPAELPNGDRICFACNLASGCSLAKPGEKCSSFAELSKSLRGQQERLCCHAEAP